MANYNTQRPPNSVFGGPVPATVNGVNGLEAWDVNRVLRLWLDPRATALRLYDDGGNQRILIDGLAVLQSFSDGTRDRVQIGNLPAYTDPNGVASPAGYGGRSVDATGNLVWDTSGLASPGVMKSLGGGPANQSSTQNVTSLTYAAMPGTTLSFTLTRTVNLRTDYIFTGKITAGAGNGQIRINAGSLGVTGGAMIGVASYITSSAWLYVPAAPAGSYSASIEANVDAGGTTLNLIQSALQVSQLGA